jgi:hypothetical protein
LQPKIPKADFEMIYNKIDSDEKKELLNMFYEIDLNYIENPYYLLKNESTSRVKSTTSEQKVRKKYIRLKFQNINIIIKQDKVSHDRKNLLSVITNAVEDLFKEKSFDSQKRDFFLNTGKIQVKSKT